MDSLAILIVAALLSAIVAGCAVAFHFSKKMREVEARMRELDSQANDHQKSVHRLEAEHLKARNALEIEHHEFSKRIKEQYYSEGYDHGIAASKKDHLVEITNIRSAHREELAKREAEAEQKGRSIAKMEHEAQVKAFGVEIRPYVRIEKDVGIIKDEHKSFTGYQYQLLVNGIPAFQPHVVVEHTEEFKEVDKQTVAELLKLAHKAADLAATAYMGGSPTGALKIGQEIVQQVKV